MSQLVLFRLEAPIAAFGELAVGEMRGSQRRPSHSSIAGLVAAALGLAREDAGVEALADSYYLAVRDDSLGAPLADFHTAQTPPQKRGRVFATRRHELADKGDLGTIISRRDCWTDAQFTLLLWPKLQLVYTLQDLARALNHPTFPLFLGRRACPLSAPVAAICLDAETVATAFSAYDARQHEMRLAANLPPLHFGGQVSFDAALPKGAQAGLHILYQSSRRDALLNRKRWQFGLREEIVATFAGDAG